MIKIWTGPIRSGKTTYLKDYYLNMEEVGGFLTPDGSTLRELYDIQSRRFYEFETTDTATAVVTVGRFMFKKASFEFAIKRMTAQAEDPEIATIVIDEIGKLELKKEGFYDVMVLLLGSGKNIHLVVRDYLLDEVMEQLSALGFGDKIEVERLDRI